MYNCHKCGSSFEKGTKFCSKCGCDLEKEFLIEPVCPKCGKEYPDGSKFCDTDGSPLTTKDRMIPKCVKCGKQYPPHVKFCPDDGGQIIAEASRAYGGFGQKNMAFDFGQKVDSKEIDDLLTRGFDVNIQDYFNQGWDLYKKNIGSFIGFAVVYILILVAVGAIPVIGAFVSHWVIATPLASGFYIAAFSLLRNRQIEFNIFFKGFSYFLPLFLAGLLTGIFTTIGFLLLVLPGVYLAVSYLFTTPLILEKKMEFWQAMETSRKLITKQWFSFFLLCLAVGVLNIIGVVALVVGLLFTVPLSFCIFACAYRSIIGIDQNANE